MDTFMDTTILGAIEEGNVIFGEPFGNPNAQSSNQYSDLIEKFQEQLKREQERLEQLQNVLEERE